MSLGREISLLPKEEFEQKAFGRFLIWALSVGRWIVVFTEFIVICAFLSRFYLDRRIADLYEDVFQRQAIVKAMSNFEEEFRFLQERIKTIETLEEQSTANEILEAFIPLVPFDVTLAGFNIKEGKVEITAVALSQQGLANFWYQLDESKNFDKVKITNVSKDEKKVGIAFTVVANFIGFTKEGKNATTF